MFTLCGSSVLEFFSSSRRGFENTSVAHVANLIFAKNVQLYSHRGILFIAQILLGTRYCAEH